MIKNSYLCHKCGYGGCISQIFSLVAAILVLVFYVKFLMKTNQLNCDIVLQATLNFFPYKLILEDR